MRVLIQEKDGTRKPIDPEDVVVDGVKLSVIVERLSTLEIAVSKNKDTSDKATKSLTEAVTVLAKDVDTIKKSLVKVMGGTNNA